MGDMVRNDGVTWNVAVWRGDGQMMQCKMWWNDVTRCEMPQWQCVTLTFKSDHHSSIFHIKPQQHIILHHTTFHVFQYHQITRRDVKFGVMCNVLQCQMGCCTLFTLWLWCGLVRCNVEYVRHQWCDAVMSCNVRCEMWCDVEWCSAWGMWRCADARCEMWLWK